MSNVKTPVNEDQKRFFDVLIENGGNITAAAEAVGYARGHGYKLARDYREYLTERMESVLVLNGVRAVHVLSDALHDRGIDPGVKTKLNAAESILDRIGIIKNTGQRVELNGPSGVFFLPAKEDDNDSKEA